MAEHLAILERIVMPFAQLLGVRLLSAAPERVEAELVVREELCTQPAVLHGGAMMAFADALGAWATVLNLPDGAWTTTVESKTNFFGPAPLGAKLVATCTPLHRGRRTMVWQTRVTSDKGRLLAMVTQTQLVIDGGEARASATKQPSKRDG